MEAADIARNAIDEITKIIKKQSAGTHVRGSFLCIAFFPFHPFQSIAETLLFGRFTIN